MTKLCRIPNWSPTVDFVTSNESSRWDNFDGATGKLNKEYNRQQDGRTALVGNDRIYAGSGSGPNGSIVEYRHGLQASIGIEFEFGAVIRRCFLLSTVDPVPGYHLILSVAGGSTVLYFDEDFSANSAREIDQDHAAYDLSSPTLIAESLDQGGILQVTETGLLFSMPWSR